MTDEESPLISSNPPTRTSQVSLLLPCLIGVFLASADSSLLLVTQDEIASSFHSESSAPLLLIAYSLGYSIALPVFGALSDIYGCRRFLLAAYTFFAAGCLISGIAGTTRQFIASRVVAGIGGAGMIDLVSVLVTELFDITEVATVRAYVLSASIFGQSFGGPLGGFLADTVGWRWSLLGQTPIALICLVLAAWRLPSTSTKDSLDGSKRVPKLWEIDFMGAASFFISTGSFILLLNQNGINSSTIYLALSFVIFGVTFILIETTWAQYPIIAPSLLRTHSLGWTFLGQFLVHCSFFIILAHLGPYFARAEHLSNTEIAARFWPSSMGFIVGSVMAGRIIKMSTRYQRVAIVGVLILVGCNVLMAFRWMHGVRGLEFLYVVPWGISAGLWLSSQFIALIVCTPKDQAASATGVYYFFQQLGVIIGTGIGASVLRTIFRQQLLSNHLDKQLIDKIIDDADFTATLPTATQQIINVSYSHAFGSIPWLSLGFAALLIPITIFHRERDMRAE